MYKNILFIYYSFNEGGVPRRIMMFANILKKKCNTVTIAGKNGALVNRIKNDGIIFYELSQKFKKGIFLFQIYYYLIELVKLARYVKKSNINLIVNDGRYTSIMSWIISIIYKIQYYSVAHGVYEGYSFLKNTFWGDKVLCVSRDVRDNLVNNFSVLLSKTTIIQNSVPRITENSKTEIDDFIQHLSLENKRIICSVGRFDKIKGINYLIESWQNVIKEIPNAYLLIVGYGEYEWEFKSLIRSINMDKFITILDSTTNVTQVLSVSEFSVLPSLREGISSFVLESFSLGRPVVATNVVGTREIIKHNYNGILVRAKSPTDLASGIIKMYSLSNKDFNKLCKNALHTYENDFSYEIYSQKITDYFLS